MEGLIILILIIIVVKILFGRDVHGGVDGHVFWTPSPLLTGLKRILRIIILFVIIAVLLAYCSSM